MRQGKKEKLTIRSLLEEPIITYPPHYTLSPALIDNEMLHDALIALHGLNFEHYRQPGSHEEIFHSLQHGSFAVYKENYIAGYFGGKLMYLQQSGWSSMRATQELFMLENWLVPG